MGAGCVTQPVTLPQMHQGAQDRGGILSTGGSVPLEFFELKCLRSVPCVLLGVVGFSNLPKVLDVAG